MALPQIPTDYVAHWTGSISGGLLVDESGNYHGTINGTVNREIGRVGESAKFIPNATHTLNGSAIIAAAPIKANDAKTIAGFVRVDDMAIGLPIYTTREYNDTPLCGFRVKVTSTGAVEYNHTGVGGVLTSAGTLVQGEVAHVAVTMTVGRSVVIYINGNVAATGSVGAGLNSGSEDQTDIGRQSWEGGNGWINRLRAYNYVLTQDQIKALALEKSTIPTSNLAAAWDFRDLAAGVVPDSAPGADGTYDATLTGTIPKVGMKAGIGGKFSNPLAAAAQNYLTLGSILTISGDFTATATMTYDASKDRACIGGFNVGQPYWFIYVDAVAGTINIDSDEGNALINIGALTNGVEYNFTLTRTGTTYEAYLDGISKGTVAGNAANARFQHLGIYTPPNPSTVHNAWPTAQIRVYSVALSPAEIALLATELPKVPTAGLVSEWTGDNVQGSTLKDEMGAYDLTMSGVTQGSGVVGNSLIFNGASSYAYATLPTAFKVQTIAISVLFKVQSFLNGTAMISLQPTGAYADGRGLVLAIGASSNISAKVGNTAASSWQAVDSGTLSVDTWYHGLMKVSGGTSRLYVGGVEVGSLAIGTINWTDSGAGPTPATLYLGSEHNNTSGQIPNTAFFSGEEERIRVYLSDLDDLDILALANESPYGYTLSGTVTEEGLPVARTVAAYNASTRALIAETISSAVDGTYSLTIPAGVSAIPVVIPVGNYRPLAHGPIVEGS